MIKQPQPFAGDDGGGGGGGGEGSLRLSPSSSLLVKRYRVKVDPTTSQPVTIATDMSTITFAVRLVVGGGGGGLGGGGGGEVVLKWIRDREAARREVEFMSVLEGGRVPHVLSGVEVLEGGIVGEVVEGWEEVNGRGRGGGGD
ncbi:hypothetical protein HDU67_001013, partial [Dinochytrium kinnereticum]